MGAGFQVPRRVPVENRTYHVLSTIIRSVIDKTTGMPYIMIESHFEWNDEKAAANWRNHGVTFAQAARAFGDPFAIENFDDREDYAEQRVNLIGMCEGTLLHVTYTEREARIRIISARRAVRHEKDDYYRENAS